MRRWILCTILFAFLIGCHGGTAFAEYLPEIQIEEENKYSVAFFPQDIPIYLYKNITPDARIDAAQLRNALYRQANANPYFRVISRNEIENKFRNAKLSQTDAYMQAEIDMGYAREFMNNMNFSAAIDMTRTIIENYRKSYVQYIQPQTVATAYQQLAYALIAKYQENPDTEYELLHPARLAFLELYRLAPYISMLEGRQAKERVSLYNQAMELFLSNEVYRQIPKEDAGQIAGMLDADILLFPRIVQDKTGALTLEIDQYNKYDDEMTHLHKKLDFSDAESPDVYVQDITTWMLSNTYTCIHAKPNVISTTHSLRDDNRFFFNVGLSYSSFIRYPTNDFPNALGVNIQFAYLLNQYLYMQTGAIIYEVFQDKAHELLNNFEIYEFPIAIGIIKEWEYIKIFASIGFSVGFSSSFKVTRSIQCKTFGVDDLECNPWDVNEKRDVFSFMLDTSFGFSAGVAPFFGSIEGFINPTLYPTDNKLFRHQLGLRASVQYWF